jgi:putative flavoprotein involved in K+ transport
MAVEEVEVLVVGGGQAGIAVSEHLSRAEVPHLVLERNRIAERWRSERWDSLVANGPCWHDRFPGLAFEDFDPDQFVPKESMADYLVAYAEKFKAPVRTGVEVTSVKKHPSGVGFDVTTNQGDIYAKFVVAATGPFHVANIPTVIPSSDSLMQIHSAAYKNPNQLPAGAVLVVGAGSSGVQIAAELRRAGREVFLSVGAHDRPPRRYRGRDNVWWLGVLGKWDMTTPPAGAEHVTIAVTGDQGGHTVDFRNLANSGITLVGVTKGFENGAIKFADDLEASISRGDANYLSVLQEADAYIERNALDLPEEKEAHILGPMPDCVTNPLAELDLAAAGVTSIVWATGYGIDYSWLQVDTFDENGKPAHQRGVGKEQGIYFLGLPWLSRRGSTFLWGVWHDAKYVADQIGIQRGYRAYNGNARIVTSGGNK